jgi:AcrR family transcriptional regulator
MQKPVRKPTAERRKEIVMAVLKIVSERGLPALTTATIAAEVGVTSGAIFRHFASIDDIFAAVVEYALNEIEGTFPAVSNPPDERLFEFAQNRITLLRSAPGLAWLMRSEQAYLILPAKSAALLKDVAKRSKKFILDALKAGAQAGSIRKDIDPDHMLVMILGTIHALIGMPGGRRLSATAQQQQSGLVLDALAHMVKVPAK